MTLADLFIQAILRGDIDRVSKFSKYLTNYHGNVGLYYACGKGDLEMARYLIWNRLADNVYHAFPEAAYSGNIKLVEYLLKVCPYVDYNYALQTSSLAGNIAMFEFVLAKLKDFDFEETPPFSLCLSQAAQGGHREMIIYLVEKYNVKNFDDAIQELNDDLCVMDEKDKEKTKDMIEWLKELKVKYV